MRVLIVEDEKRIASFIQRGLKEERYAVDLAPDGEQGLYLAGINSYDLIILDIMLPGRDGIAVCQELRRNKIDTPILMLTARDSIEDKVTGLDVGADDYLTKPFSPRELLARIKAVLRRQQSDASAEATVVYNDVVIHPGRYEVRLGDQSVQLTPTEFHILHFLARRPGWVFTRYQIVDAVRGEDADVTERSVDVHVAAIRRKLGNYRDRIETLRGVGYRFKAS